MRGEFEPNPGYYPSRVRDDLPDVSAPPESSGLAVVVLFTTVRGTLHALQHAARLAYQLQARIQIIVPYVVPYPLPIDKATVDPKFRLREFLTRCEQQPIETRIDIWLCRDVRQCIEDRLLPNSLVVVGGRQSWCPLTFEKRLAKSLRSAGHQVVFIAYGKTAATR